MDELFQQGDISASELVDGYSNPLRGFTGTLDSLQVEQDNRFNRIIDMLTFTNISDVDAREPYDFPIVQIRLPVSKQRKSQMGMFLTSLEKASGKKGCRISDFLHKRMRLEIVLENLKWQSETEDKFKECWEVMEILDDKNSAYFTALELAIGKNIHDLKSFYQEALKHPDIKKDSAIASKLLNKTLLKEAMAKGDIVVIDDVITTPSAE